MPKEAQHSPSIGQELELRARKVHEHAAKALELIRQVIQSSEKWDTFYAIRSRAKSVDQIIDKVHRRRIGDEKKRPVSDYEPEAITDIVGLCIITLFREDIIDATQTIAGMIAHRNFHHSPFEANKTEEIIYYSTAPGDPQGISSYIGGIVESYGFTTLRGNDPVHFGEPILTSDYSSVHIIAWCRVFDDDGGLHRVPVEIQIRTVFEDAWGEVDHKLLYTPFRAATFKGHRLHLLRNQLNAFKKHCDGSAQDADVAREILRDVLRQKLHYYETFQPVGSYQKAVEQIAGLPEGLKRRLRTAYQVREDAFESRRSGRDYHTSLRERRLSIRAYWIHLRG